MTRMLPTGEPRMTRILAALLCTSILLSSTAEAGSWARLFGGVANDYPYSITTTADGGCVVTGYTATYGMGRNDMMVARLSKTGRLLWTKTFGGWDWDSASSVIRRAAGGYLVAGSTKSFGAGWYDAWLVRIDSSGRLVWQKAYGGGNGEWIDAIRETREGGIIAVGGTYTYGAGESDTLLMKLSGSGKLQWARAFGGSNYDDCSSVELTLDGGYIIGGSTLSYGAGHWDCWLLKLDAAGAIQWERVYGGQQNDVLMAVRPTMDGGYVATGWTHSFGSACFVLKLGPSGAIQWQKVYGKGRYDSGDQIECTSDGGYCLVGVIDGWGSLLKLDSTGTIVWQRRYSMAVDPLAGFVHANDGWFTIAGGVRSSPGEDDTCVLRVDPEGKMPRCPALVIDGTAVPQSVRVWSAATRSAVTRPLLSVTNTTAGSVNAQPQHVDLCTGGLIPVRLSSKQP